MPARRVLAGAAGLSWQMLPSLQYDSAYIARLDLDPAAVFQGPDRPSWIRVMNVGIDGRRQISKNSETWLAIMDNYAVVDRDEQSDQILLPAREPAGATRTGL